jgi:hypothetical protein
LLSGRPVTYGLESSKQNGLLDIGINARQEQPESGRTG